MASAYESSFKHRRTTVVLAGLTLLVLALSVPASLQYARETGGLYLFSLAFFEDIPKRLTGPGRFRLVLQPLLALLLGIRSGVADARAGRPAYLYGLLFSHAHRLELLKSAFVTVANLVLMGILIDSVCQWFILGISYPGAALVVGPVLIMVPYALARALSHRISHLAKKTLPVFAMVWLALAGETSAQPVEALTTNTPPGESGTTLTLAHRQIMIFRATLDGFSPEEREAAAAARLQSVLAKAKTMLVTTQAVPTGVQLTLDGQPLFVITPGDVSKLRGESMETKAGNVAAALRSALHEMHSLSTPRQLARALGLALLGFGYFVVLAWAARRLKHWLLLRSTRLAAEKTEKVSSRELRAAGLRSFVAVQRAVLTFLYYLWLGFLVYALLWYELRCFPYSRPWGDYLRSHCLAAFAAFGSGLWDALPGLAVVVLIVLAARMLTQVFSKVFIAVERGEVQARRLDPATAAITRRLVVFAIWVIAVVVAYPYIPGSQTLAFKGVTVFIGLVISLGSTNIVNQLASGLLLIYSRAFRAGDYVRVEEAEGTVMEVGLCATHICTIKNEEVYIANSVLLGAATKNYSRLAEEKALLLPVKVTIGYSTPWRQVHALLLEAARRTPGLAREPQPFVLQASLSDFYVEYELNARLERPDRRVWVLSDLNTHIQDVFNEYGVQIMSPHYLQDPPKPHVVPKADWFLPPASPPLDSHPNPPETSRGRSA